MIVEAEAGTALPAPVDDSTFTTPLDGTEQDVLGSIASPVGALDDAESGVVRLYPDLVNMGVSDTVVFRFYRTNDGSNLRLVDTVTFSAAQTNDAPMLEVAVTDARTVRITVQRTAGTVTNVPIGVLQIGE